MLNLFLHGAVPLGYMPPMDDDDARYGDRGRPGAEDERGRHLARGKSPFTCYVVPPGLQVRMTDSGCSVPVMLPRQVG